MGFTLIIGDLHGCFDELLALLDAARLGAADRAICVGDLVVKGPKNREVLDLFMTDARLQSVMGNHDLALVQSWRGEPTELTEEQLMALRELDRSRYIDYLSSLPFYLDLGEQLVVHAGLRPGLPIEKQKIEDLVSMRTLGPDRTNRQATPWYEVYAGDKFIFFGHWPAAQPRRGPRALGLDTGCVYGGLLTGYIIERDELVAVSGGARLREMGLCYNDVTRRA